MATIDPIVGLGHMWAHSFIRYGFVAGTAIAVCSGLVGYFVVLRGPGLHRDALSHVAFTGALAALAFGFDLRLGLFVGSIGIALLLGLLGRRARADDVVIGSVFAWVLGLGVLFLSIFTTERATGNSSAGTAVLFGSLLGLDADQALVAVAVGLAVAVAVLVIARPLLFASLDATAAAARGVPVTLLGYGVPCPGGGDRGRGHPGGRRPAPARAAGRARRHRPTAHGTALSGHGAVSGGGRVGHLDRTHHQLRRRRHPAQLRHPLGDHRGLRGRGPVGSPAESRGDTGRRPRDCRATGA